MKMNSRKWEIAKSVEMWVIGALLNDIDSIKDDVIRNGVRYSFRNKIEWLQCGAERVEYSQSNTFNNDNLWILRLLWRRT